MHCASLIHDDLPCFDNAKTRRGRPALHREFGEPLALLTGDGLIVLALQWLALEGRDSGAMLPALHNQLACAVGAPAGIVAGQSWEEESEIDLRAYHEAKTGALFSAATAGGALAGGGEALAWGRLGARLGEAYQVADDLRDALGDSEELGKPVGVDQALGRPSAVLELGVEGAAQRLRDLVGEALASIPPCPGRPALLATIEAQAKAILAGCKVRAAA
jgi:geranylgeranyl diphosphate synthase type II